MTRDALTALVATFVVEASEGAVTRDEAMTPGLTFPEMGLTSLAYLRLIDAVETRLGVYLDLDDESGSLETVDGIVDQLCGREIGVDG
jgi:acyl carrier protein